MKAWVVSQRGEPSDALTLRTDLIQPSEPAASNVIVEVTHAALNPADVNFIRFIPSLPFRRQPIPGLDFSGRISAAGSRVPAHFVVGAEVCGVLPVSQVVRGTGTLVEYLEISADAIALRPSGLSLESSAGLGLVAQTALLMIKSRPVQAGERIIVHGASGGVGTMVLQLASASAGLIVGVCSEANAGMVQRLGAHETVDYTRGDSLADLICSQYPEPFDAVYNCVGDSQLYSNSHKFLKPDGVYIDIAGPGGPVASYWRTLSTHWLPRFLGGSSGIRYNTVNLAPSGALQNEVVKLVNDGVIREVAIDSVCPLEQAKEAYARVMSKRAKGKVVVQL